MNPLRKYLAPLITGLIVLSLSSCTSSPTNRQSDKANSPTQEMGNVPSTTLSARSATTPAQPQVQTPVTRQPSNTTGSIAQAKDTVTLTIYQADNQCQTLVPEKVAVPATRVVDTAVGEVLKQADSGDFDLAGYRVQVNSNSGVATVDFRLSPNSRRQFVSLSSCEQFALFGSLRKTLTTNSQLKIKNVRFTQQGQEIVI
ncbi:germination protein [Allocoleopsis franciscana]|uniref:Sporulation/spore germination protein n=1 Tax=Allocoleopsis franciscana PCC 7113 TaxID=1173027 RepID=K9WL79_9CYAN|nr:germination protein [Allocoleopsis franciscana]AFZ21150.1 sporulation/spore germination protein [Allocoleopsis franciscana PCC 7113]